MPGFLDQKLLFFASILLFFLKTAFSLPDGTPYHYAIFSNIPIDKKVQEKPSNFIELLNRLYEDGSLSPTTAKPGTQTRSQLKEINLPWLLQKSKDAELPQIDPVDWPTMDPINWSPIRPMRSSMFPSMEWMDPLKIPFPKIPPITTLTPQDILLSFKIRPEDLQLNKFHFITGHIVMEPKNLEKAKKLITSGTPTPLTAK